MIRCKPISALFCANTLKRFVLGVRVYSTPRGSRWSNIGCCCTCMCNFSHIWICTPIARLTTAGIYYCAFIHIWRIVVSILLVNNIVSNPSFHVSFLCLCVNAILTLIQFYTINDYHTVLYQPLKFAPLVWNYPVSKKHFIYTD